MKNIVLIMSLIVVEVLSKPNDKVNGFWGAELNNGKSVTEIVLYIHTNEKSQIICEIHSYSNRVKSGSIRVVNLKFNYPSISMTTNEQSNVTYSGTIDGSANMIEGRLIYNNSTGRELNFTKVDKNEIKINHPGLLGIEKQNTTYTLPELGDSSWEITEMSEDEFNIGLLEEMLKKS